MTEDDGKTGNGADESASQGEQKQQKSQETPTGSAKSFAERIAGWLTPGKAQAAGLKRPLVSNSLADDSAEDPPPEGNGKPSVGDPAPADPAINSGGQGIQHSDPVISRTPETSHQTIIRDLGTTDTEPESEGGYHPQSAENSEAPPTTAPSLDPQTHSELEPQSQPAPPPAPKLPKAGREPPPRFEFENPNYWRIAAVSAIGRHHSEQNEPCEDAWAVAETSNGIIVGIASDGAGSALHSRFASQFVSNVVGEIVRELETYSTTAPTAQPETLRPIRRIVKRQLGLARNRLIGEATDAGDDPDDYLCTVVGAVAHPAIGVLLFHIGDGTAAVLDENGQSIVVSQPENGEYDNETYFLVEDIWQQHFRCRFARAITKGGEGSPRQFDIFLMSDGATDLAYNRMGPRREPAESFFRPVTAALVREERARGEQLLTGTLMSDAANARSDDDKTIVWMRSLSATIASQST